MSRVLLGYDIQNAKRRRWALRHLRTLTACYQESFSTACWTGARCRVSGSG